MSNRAIPVVDLEKFTKGDAGQRNDFVNEIGNAFQVYGFVGVVNHGIPEDLVEAFYDLSKKYFALPVETKRTHEVDGLAGQRGYTSFGKEHAKQSQVADLKEFFQFGQYVDADDSLREEYPDNVNVPEINEFNDVAKSLYKAFEESGAELLKAIALFLGLDENYFESHIEKGNSILRTIHYPPITQEPESAIRSEQHEDINLITLLFGAAAGGLQILNMDEEWLDIVPGENEIVINVGDMLQRLTNNKLKSTTHRVINPPRHQWHLPRVSIPFFLHPKSDMDLTCLESCISNENPKIYSDMTAGEYLDERLREIGLKK